MSTDPSAPEALKALWRSQPLEAPTMSLTAITRQADLFQHRIRRRNLMEYAAAVLVVAFMGYGLAFGDSGWMMRSWQVLTILAVLFVVWRLHRRGRAVALPPDASAQSLIDFQKRELIRQRDLLRSVPFWYVAPFLPGSAMLFLARWLEEPSHRWTRAHDHAVIIATFAIMLLVLAGVCVLNLWGAARLQRMIDRLERTRAE